MKEATLSIIASKLLLEEQQDALTKIFKIMDTTGDGKIGPEEIQHGFLEILGEEISIDACKKIIANVDQDDNGFIDQRDFLIGSIDFSFESFKGYIMRAKDLLFSTQDTIDI